MRRSWASLLLLALMILGGPLFAAPPKVVLFLVSGGSGADFAPGGRFERLRSFAERGSIALLDAPVQGERTKAAIYLSLGAGRPLTVPDKTSPKFVEGGLPRTLADIATDVYRSDTREGTVVCRTYRRRFGQYPPLQSKVVHIGVPALIRAQPTTSDAAQIGAFGEALRKAGKKVAVYGGWQAILVGMDRRAAVDTVGALHPLEQRGIPAALDTCDVLIYHEERPDRLIGFLPDLAKLASSRRANVFIAALPIHPEPYAPGWLIGVGPSLPGGTLLRSPAAEKPGQVSSIDITPTIASALKVPLSGVSGRVLQTQQATESVWKTVDVPRFSVTVPHDPLFYVIVVAIVLLLFFFARLIIKLFD